MIWEDPRGPARTAYPRAWPDRPSTRIPLRPPLSRRSFGGRAAHAYLAFLRVGFTLPRGSRRRAVGSYPAVSPLPLQAFGGRRSSETSLPASKFGGLFSVALSLTNLAIRRFPLGTTLSCGARTFLPPSPRCPLAGLAAVSGNGSFGGRSPRRPQILKDRKTRSTQRSGGRREGAARLTTKIIRVGPGGSKSTVRTESGFVRYAVP